MRWPSNFVAGMLLAMGVTPAVAVQDLSIRPDGTANARIAVRETTRIRVDGKPIVDVFGSVRTRENPDGELQVTPDVATGEIYVIPAASATPGKPINIFLKTADGTYTLLLTPLDIPSDTVVLRDRAGPARSAAPRGHAPDWLREIKNMVLAMRLRTVPSGYVAEDTMKPVRLWQEARFVELRRVTGTYLTGTVYSLTNVSAAPMVLDAREFTDTGVAAVAVEREYLAPGEATRVHVIRERDRD